MNREFLPEDHVAREQAADPRFNVALEASAGTGKTSVLVDRYLRLIEEGASPRHILAITFTRKASGEMKSRIIEELRRRDALWSTLRDRLFDIHIATIDAFCLGLLKEFPLEAGLDPDVDLLDEVDTQRLTEMALDETLAVSVSRFSDGPDMGFLISTFGEPALRRSLRDLLRNRLVREEALRRFVRTRIPRQLDLDSVLARAVESLSDVLGGQEGVAQLFATGPERSLPQCRSLFFAFLRAVDPERATPLDIEQVAAYFLTEGEKLPRKKLSPLFRIGDFPSRASYQNHRDRVLAFAPAVAEVHSRWFADRDLYGVREMWKLGRIASKRFHDLKESRRGLDFTDVLVQAVGLLERREEFSQSRFRLESRYHHLLIDEFQDTNEVQWRLVRALIDSWGEGSGLVQAAILAEQASGRGTGKLQEPSIFIVGDRKQSIYGWRDARVEVMEKAARQLLRLRPGGRRLTIRQSFRAEGTLLDFLNDVFSSVPQISHDLEWSFRYRESDHFPVRESKEERCPVGIVFQPDLPRAAAAVADEIVRLLKEEHARPKDIAILFRSRTHYRVYENALADRGVPTYVYRGLGFFDSPEVKDIQALVRFLSEPGSELRAAELLRSRFLGVSDTGLARLAAERGRPRGEGPLGRLLRGETSERDFPPTLSSLDRSTAAWASANVPKWIERVDRLPPADLVQEILDETDYAGCLSGRKGAQGWENLKKILEILRRAQNRGYLTLSRLAEFLNSASAGEESLAVLEAVDAVNLMTIHAAKGLEFDTVFVVNMDQTTRTDVSLPRIKEKPEGEVEVHALGRPESEGPARSVEEEKRLLYVALTRARAHLVLCASGTAEVERKTTFLNLLPDDLRALFQEADTSQQNELDWTPGDRTHRIRRIRPHLEPGRHRSSQEEPVHRSHLGALGDGQPTRITVSELVRELTGDTPRTRSEDPADAAVGKIVHRMFEYSVPIDGSLAERAESLSAELSGRSPEERKQSAQSAAELYRELMERQELRDLLDTSAGGQIFREVSFALRRRDRIVRGTIDSLLLLDGRVTVIDYKTGGHRPEHDLQMQLYLEAAHELFPAFEVQGVVFYTSGEPRRISLQAKNPGSDSQPKLF